jgi:hypothetical protein
MNVLRMATVTGLPIHWVFSRWSGEQLEVEAHRIFTDMDRQKRELAYVCKPRQLIGIYTFHNRGVFF